MTRHVEFDPDNDSFQKFDTLAPKIEEVVGSAEAARAFTNAIEPVLREFLYRPFLRKEDMDAASTTFRTLRKLVGQAQEILPELGGSSSIYLEGVKGYSPSAIERYSEEARTLLGMLDGAIDATPNFRHRDPFIYKLISETAAYASEHLGLEIQKTPHTPFNQVLDLVLEAAEVKLGSDRVRLIQDSLDLYPIDIEP